MQEFVVFFTKLFVLNKIRKSKFVEIFSLMEKKAEIDS